jgi:hypothetical protein
MGFTRVGYPTSAAAQASRFKLLLGEGYIVLWFDQTGAVNVCHGLFLGQKYHPKQCI